MKMEAKKCRQCGRIIYFDGICITCRTQNERDRILALSQEEIDTAVGQICGEIEETGKLDREENLFTELLNYRDIDTSRIAEAAFRKNLFYPCEMYKDATNDGGAASEGVRENRLIIKVSDHWQKSQKSVCH